MKFAVSPHVSRPSAATAFGCALALAMLAAASPALASSEANLVLPNLRDATIASFLGGVSGWQLLAYGLIVCLAGLAFGAIVYSQVKAMPVHRSMAEVSELIYDVAARDKFRRNARYLLS